MLHTAKYGSAVHHKVGAVNRWVQPGKSAAIFLVAVAAMVDVQQLALKVVLIELNRVAVFVRIGISMASQPDKRDKN